MFTIEKFRNECANISNETELREKIEECARYFGYEVRQRSANLSDYFPYGDVEEE